MKMTIAGSGQIPSGEYDEIAIFGSGKLVGMLRCASFRCSGSTRGDHLESAGPFTLSGSAKFKESVKAENISISGSLTCGGNLAAKEQLKCSGSAKIEGSLTCRSLLVSGAVTVQGNIEGETVQIDGKLHCGGLLNADEITIHLGGSSMDIESMGGSRVTIQSNFCNTVPAKLPVLRSLFNKPTGQVRIGQAIEADQITVEHVVSPRVSGRMVSIGDHCVIDLVQYSERIEISPLAQVRKTEKV